MNKPRSLRLVPSQEIKEAIRYCKSNIFQHIEKRPSNQVNDSFINHMENQIEELTQELKERKVA